MKSKKISNRRGHALETFESRSYLAAHIAGNATNYATIQAAVDAASPGAVIDVDAGTYNETVSIFKSLTIRGAQAGVDARAGRGAETIVFAPQTVFHVRANNVTLDGLSIQGNKSAIGGAKGAGVYMGPSINGTRVLNNIIQNNVTGLYLSNNSNTNAAVISRNYFYNNYQTNSDWTYGWNGSRQIYTDGEVSGGLLTNVLIDNNLFKKDANGTGEGMIALAAQGAGKQFNITISNNNFLSINNVSSKAIIIFNTTNLTFIGNNAQGHNDTSSGPLRFEGNANNINIQYNSVHDNAGPGVAIDAAGVPGDSSGFVIRNNNIYANRVNNLGVISQASMYNGALDTRNNWWGHASGPSGMGPGTGQAVWGDGTTGHYTTPVGKAGGTVLFSPWATSLINITNIPAPATPTGLTAAGETSTSLLLNWTPQMSTATSQLVQRSIDGVNFVTVATLPPLLNAYTDTGLTSGQAYVYRVIAANATGNSAASSTATATPPPYQAPVAPTNLAVTATTGSTVTLTWAMPTNAMGIASYTIYRNGVAVGTSTSRSFTNYGLTSSTMYSYSVATTDTTAATSAPSTSINATTVAAQFGDNSFESGGINTYVYNPSNPFWTFSAASGIEANGSGWGAANAPQGTRAAFLQNAGSMTQTMGVGVAGTYTVSFSSARRANYGTNPIIFSVDGVNITTITPASNAWGSSTTATFTLSAGVHVFKFAGTVVTGDVASFVDNVSLRLASPSGPPAAPSGLTAFGATTTQVSLSWLLAGVTPTSYTLLRSTDNVTFTTVITNLTGAATTYNDTGLTAGTMYYYKLIAVNPAGSSAATAAVSARTLSSAATVRQLSTLNWVSATSGWRTVQKNVSISGNPLILKGRTYASGLGVHANSAVVYNLGGAYTLFQVDVGVDDAVASGRPAAIAFQVFGDGVLLASTGVLSRASATVSLNVSVDGVQTLSLVASSGIEGSIDYAHADWAGAQLVANPQAPAAPTGVSASALTTTSIKVLWSAASGATATGYKVERSLDGTTWAPAATVAANVLSYTDTGLTNGTTYAYRVRATNAAGDSAVSTTASTTPLSSSAITTQLSSLNWTSAAAGYGSVQKNLNGAGDSLNLDGTVYASGIGTHTDSTIVYDLAGAYATFQSDIGFDYRTLGRAADPARFQVLGDGVVLFDSGSMSNTDPIQSINISVAGVTTLTLIANAVVPGNIDYGHVNWAGAKLIS